MVELILRVLPYLEAASGVLCRRQIVVPLIVVFVVSLPLVPILPGVCLISLCLLVILWSTSSYFGTLRDGSVR